MIIVLPPHQSKRDLAERRKMEAPPPPNAPDIPDGSYRGSCEGCSLEDAGRALRCTHCVDTRRRKIESVIPVDLCAEVEQIGNHDGKLACEPKPQPALGQDDGGQTEEDESVDGEGDEVESDSGAKEEL